MSAQIDWEARADAVIERMKQQLADVEFSKVDKSSTVKKAWKEELNIAKKAVQTAAKSAIPQDKAGAWKGVKTMNYKQVTGGNINILSSRGTKLNMTIYNRAHKRYTSERTKMVESYWGESRSFILRFLNQGTTNRTAGSKGNSRGGSGNRGALTARSWFAGAANPAMEHAAEKLKEAFATVMENNFYKQ